MQWLPFKMREEYIGKVETVVGCDAEVCKAVMVLLLSCNKRRGEIR